MGEEYLGDGLYVSFSGYDFKLRAPRDEGEHVVFLDTHMLDALNHYVKRCLSRDRITPDIA